MKDVLEALVEQVVIVANEEIAGLWEVIAECRNLAPNLSEVDLRVTARQALGAALAENWVRLVVGSFTKNEWIPLNRDEVSAVLVNPLNWYPPATHEAWHIRFETTEAGEREFRRRLHK